MGERLILVTTLFFFFFFWLRFKKGFELFHLRKYLEPTGGGSLELFESMAYRSLAGTVLEAFRGHLKLVVCSWKFEVVN